MPTIQGYCWNPQMVTIPLPDNFKLPAMRLVRQRFDLTPEVDVAAEIEREFRNIEGELRLAGGKRVAVGVGSRGIANLVRIVREVVKKLKDAGAEPLLHRPWDHMAALLPRGRSRC